MQTNKNKKLFVAELRLAGFITLLVCIVAFTGIVTYRNINKIITDVEKGTSTISNATTLKQIAGDLNIMESNVRSFFYTGDSLYLVYNDSLKIQIVTKLSLIKANKSNNKLSSVYTDSVSGIIDSKFLIFNEWISLAHNIEVTNKLTTIPDKLEDSNTFIDIEKVKNKKKKEKLLEEANKVDINDVKNEIEKARKDQLLFLKLLDKKTLQLNEHSTVLSLQLRHIIIAIENNERILLAKNNTEAANKAKFTNFIIALFSISSIVLLLIISIVFIRYVRTTNAYNKALKNARLEAESLALAKQNFLANMTHELRTPINSIIGFSDLLQKTELNIEQQEQISIVKKSSIHLLKVVNEVLDYSKLQAGKFSFEKIIFEPEVTINEVIDILSVEAEKKKINFIFYAEKNIPHFLKGDPFRLQQILLNIIGNAIKFTGSGSVTVNVRAESMDDNTSFLNIEVKDTGIGIPVEQQSKVFDEFEQADTRVDSKYRGTGLGLSISKKLVELQNGSINMYSKVGEGTLVNIIIPYQLATSSDGDSLNEISPDLKFLKNKKILVVDDEVYNRMLLQKIFINWGVKFVEAENGKQAVDFINTQPCDLVLMDIRMPLMSGFEATQIIRNSTNSKIKNIPIIALTASNDPEKEKKCLDSGMNAFVSKPFTEKKLLDTLKKFLDNNQYEMVTADEVELAEEVSSGETVNINELIKSSNGDMIFVKDMIKLFINGTADGLGQMKKSYYDSKYTEIKEQAHKIASPCRHIGAYTLLQHLKDIEIHATGEINTAVLLEHIQLADTESQKVFAELEKHL